MPLDEPLLTLSGYLKFSGAFYFVVTIWLLLFKSEVNVKVNGPRCHANHLLETCLVNRRKYVHRQGLQHYVEHLQTEEYGSVSSTRAATHVEYHLDIQTLCIVHLIAKIGFQANEAVTDLKLVEKGLSKEDLALVVLIDFPFQMLGGWLAGRWSVGEHKLRPWLHGYWIRLGFAFVSMGLVYWFPRTRPVPMSFLLLVILIKVLSSFAG